MHNIKSLLTAILFVFAVEILADIPNEIGYRYYIRSKYNGTAIQPDAFEPVGGAVRQKEFDPALGAQMWSLLDDENNPGYFRLWNSAGTMRISTDNSTIQADFYTNEFDPFQLVQFVDAGDGCFYIRFKEGPTQNSMYLQTPANGALGQPLTPVNFTGSDNTKFEFTWIGPPLPEGGHSSWLRGVLLGEEGAGLKNVLGTSKVVNQTGYWFLSSDNNPFAIFRTDIENILEEVSVSYYRSWDWGVDDPTAFSAAYNAQVTQRYFSEVMNRDGYNDVGHQLSITISDEPLSIGPHWRWGSMAIDRGNPASSLGPSSVLDVIAHEAFHGARESEMEVVSTNEQGALNESYADIFSVLVEFWHQDNGTSIYPSSSPGKSDWLIGEDFTYHRGLRDMKDPQRLGQPSYYWGTYFHDYNTNPGDRGGTHMNANVINHAFYLLAEGGSGDNDGHSYAGLVPFGIERAGEIALEAALNGNPLDNFLDTRELWVLAANDNEKYHVSRVFAAVGIGPEVINIVPTILTPLLLN